MKASGVISLGTVPPLLPEFDRKSEGAGSEGIFLRSVWEPVPDSLSELWSVRLSEKPVGDGTKGEGVKIRQTVKGNEQVRFKSGINFSVTLVKRTPSH